jgi:hypothetical protein
MSNTRGAEKRLRSPSRDTPNGRVTRDGKREPDADPPRDQSPGAPIVCAPPSLVIGRLEPRQDAKREDES